MLENPRRIFANFLAFQDDEGTKWDFTFMFPGWAPDRRRKFLEKYSTATGWVSGRTGFTHLFFAPWGAYRGHPTFDYRNDRDSFQKILDECRSFGVEPVVFTHTDGVNGRAFTRAQLTEWARNYYPQLRGVRLWALGWEGPQIDYDNSDVRWMWRGDEMIKWARDLRTMLGPSAVIYAHFPPGRITAWPDWPEKKTGGTEEGWWKEVAPYIDGLLNQRDFEEDESHMLAHVIGGWAPNEEGKNDYDKGDAQRIAQDWVQKDFVQMEWARNPDRWKRNAEKFLRHRFVMGVG